MDALQTNDKKVTPSFDLAKKLQVAKMAATVAGNIQRASYQKAIGIDTKSSGIDLVTTVDRECDEAIRAIFQSLCPEDSLLTEETYQEGTPINLDQTWVIDPLDGTTNYAHSFPHFAVSIAYVVQGQPQIAVVFDVMRNEMYHAIRGEGAYLNGTPIHASSVAHVDKALLATGFPYDTHLNPQANMAYFLKFMTLCHGVRRPGAAALDLAYVAAGRLDGFWELRLAPWDVAAGALLVEEAGGQVSDFQGNALRYDLRCIDIVAANGPSLHHDIVKTLTEVSQQVS